MAIAFALAVSTGVVITLRLSPERLGKLTALAIVLSVLVVVVFACSQAKSNLPLPKWLATHTDAAGSLRATVGDMAAFLTNYQIRNSSAQRWLHNYRRHK